MNVSTKLLSILISCICYNFALSQPKESDYYQIDQIYIPKEIPEYLVLAKQLPLEVRQ